MSTTITFTTNTDYAERIVTALDAVLREHANTLNPSDEILTLSALRTAFRNLLDEQATQAAEVEAFRQRVEDEKAHNARFTFRFIDVTPNALHRRRYEVHLIVDGGNPRWIGYVTKYRDSDWKRPAEWRAESRDEQVHSMTSRTRESAARELARKLGLMEVSHGEGH